MANTYQALDKPNSVGGDYVVSHHSWMKGLNSSLSSSIRTFDNGQVPSDMTRFTEASMRMIGTVLVDEKNMVRREPADNLLSQYYQTEMQITNVDQVSLENLKHTCIFILPGKSGWVRWGTLLLILKLPGVLHNRVHLGSVFDSPRPIGCLCLCSSVCHLYLQRKVVGHIPEFVPISRV